MSDLASSLSCQPLPGDRNDRYGSSRGKPGSRASATTCCPTSPTCPGSSSRSTCRCCGSPSHWWHGCWPPATGNLARPGYRGEASDGEDSYTDASRHMKDYVLEGPTA